MGRKKFRPQIHVVVDHADPRARRGHNRPVPCNGSRFETVNSRSPSDSIDADNFGNQLNYIHHNPSLGSPANWNYALKQAKGAYIKIMHHDDYFTNPDSLSEFVALLDSNPKASFAFSATKIDLLQLNMIKYHYCSMKKSVVETVYELIMCCCSSHCLYG